MTQYHQVTIIIALYWPSATKYQPVSPYTEPVPQSTNQDRPILTQYHQVPTSNYLYLPSTTKYQPVPLYSDPVTPSTNWYPPILTHIREVLGDYGMFWG